MLSNLILYLFHEDYIQPAATSSSPKLMLSKDLGIRITIQSLCFNMPLKGRRGRDRMVVGFTTTCTISVYHH